MAKVVITHFSGIFHQGAWQSSCFYDGLVSELQAAGHDVLHFITSDYICQPWNGENRSFYAELGQKLIQEIKSFNPDLVISFNNSSVQGLEDALTCPIALWDADSFQFFSDKKNIEKKADRYHYLSFSTAGELDYQKHLKISANRICRVPVVTAVKNRPLEKRYNISFIGNPFFPTEGTRRLLSENKKYFIELLNNPHLISPDDPILKKYDLKPSNLQHIFAGEKRLLTVANLAALGVDLFGPAEWQEIYPFSIHAAIGYHPQKTYSLEHNSNIYNASHLSLSAAHSQNITGYPWRVPDILASGAVLISDRKSDLISDFGDKIDLQIYDSPTEAYNLAKHLLNNPEKRRDLVAQANDVIDNSRRWPHAFQLITQHTGVNLSFQGGVPGAYRRLEIVLDGWRGMIYKGSETAIKKLLPYFLASSKGKFQQINWKRKLVDHIAPDYIKQLTARSVVKFNSTLSSNGEEN